VCVDSEIIAAKFSGIGVIIMSTAKRGRSGGNAGFLKTFGVLIIGFGLGFQVCVDLHARALV